MRGEIIKLQKQLKITQVYVTHDQVEAMSMADRIAILNDGKFQQIGTPTEVYNTPQNLFVAGFIGSPTMNFIDVRYNEGKGNTLEFANYTFELTTELAEKIKTLGLTPLVLGIRPEHIYSKEFLKDYDRRSIINAKVELIEPVGSFVILRFVIDSATMVAQVDPHTQASLGKEIELVIDMEKMHLFSLSPPNQALDIS